MEIKFMHDGQVVFKGKNITIPNVNDYLSIVCDNKNTWYIVANIIWEVFKVKDQVFSDQGQYSCIIELKKVE